MKAISLKAQSITESKKNSKVSYTKFYTSTKFTPLDFENFVPWFCLQFQVPIIVNVNKMKRGQ